MRGWDVAFDGDFWDGGLMMGRRAGRTIARSGLDDKEKELCTVRPPTRCPLRAMLCCGVSGTGDLYSIGKHVGTCPSIFCRDLLR